MSASKLRLCATASAAALGAALMLAGSGAPAEAQFVSLWGWQGPPQEEALVPPPLVYRRLESRGFALFGPLRRNGGVYLADVEDHYGRRERLVVDAYSGAILQTFAYAPPRPEADIPEVRSYAPSTATYSPRYPSAALPPTYIPPGLAPEPGLSPPRESRAKHPPARKLARREATPKKPAPAELTPSDATREPTHPISEAPPAEASHTAPKRDQGRANPESRAPQEAAVRSAPAPSAPVPAAPAAKPTPAPKPASGPGYANGVPINPLD